MRLIDADALKYELFADNYNAKMTSQEVADCIDNSPTIDAVPVVRGEWDYIIEKGSCMDYHVTAHCSECGWDWFSKEGVGNYSAVFSAFITNGDSRPEEAKRFLLENARANNKLNYCPNCEARMDGSHDN